MKEKVVNVPCPAGCNWTMGGVTGQALAAEVVIHIAEEHDVRHIDTVRPSPARALDPVRTRALELAVQHHGHELSDSIPGTAEEFLKFLEADKVDPRRHPAATAGEALRPPVAGEQLEASLWTAPLTDGGDHHHDLGTVGYSHHHSDGEQPHIHWSESDAVVLVHHV